MYTSLHLSVKIISLLLDLTAPVLEQLCSCNMNPMSQGLVLTTATVLSCTVLYLAFSSKIISPPSFISGNSNSHDSAKQIRRLCLCSDEKKTERKKEKRRKKKKVKFANNVKEASDGGEKEERKQNRVSRSCRDELQEIMGIPANQMALYNGILRGRVHKIECS